MACCRPQAESCSRRRRTLDDDKFDNERWEYLELGYTATSYPADASSTWPDYSTGYIYCFIYTRNTHRLSYGDYTF